MCLIDATGGRGKVARFALASVQIFFRPGICYNSVSIEFAMHVSAVWQAAVDLRLTLALALVLWCA